MRGLQMSVTLLGIPLLSAAIFLCFPDQDSPGAQGPTRQHTSAAKRDGDPSAPVAVVGRCPDGTAITVELLGQPQACRQPPAVSSAAQNTHHVLPDSMIATAMNGNVLAMGTLLQDLPGCVAARVPPLNDVSNRCAWVQDQAPQLIRQLEARAHQGDTQAQSELRRALAAHEQQAPSGLTTELGDPQSPSAQAKEATQDEFDRARMLLAQWDAGSTPPQPVLEASARGRPQSEPVAARVPPQ